MDLGAYCNIEMLEDIVKKNGIYCPRLRGYRLMKDEEPINITKQSLISQHLDFDIVEDLCCSRPFWNENAGVYEFSSRTRYLTEYFTDTEEQKVRWERIHGWKRKRLKTAIHNTYIKYKNQFDAWNKYAGCDDILYIHARIGGANWPHYFQEVVYQPWFLEKVDDAYDSTYCDIYARIDTERGTVIGYNNAES